MSAVDRLCELLKERDIAWEYNQELNYYEWVNGSAVVTAIPMADGRFAVQVIDALTPEQAVEATLKREACSYEFVPNIGGGHLNSCGLKCSVCGREQMSLDAPRFCPNCGRRVVE